jgi:hypothetical protein
VRRKIKFLSDKSLDISKLGDISKNEFEPVNELRKLKEQKEKRIRAGKANGEQGLIRRFRQ